MIVTGAARQDRASWAGVPQAGSRLAIRRGGSRGSGVVRGRWPPSRGSALLRAGLDRTRSRRGLVLAYPCRKEPRHPEADADDEEDDEQAEEPDVGGEEFLERDHGGSFRCDAAASLAAPAAGAG